MGLAQIRYLLKVVFNSSLEKQSRISFSKNLVNFCNEILSWTWLRLRSAISAAVLTFSLTQFWLKKTG
jgi:hypothetical protein